MSALCIRVPALRGPLPGEAPLSPAAGCCPVLRLWPGLPEEFSRPAAGGLTASGRRAVTSPGAVAYAGQPAFFAA